MNQQESIIRLIGGCRAYEAVKAAAIEARKLPGMTMCALVTKLRAEYEEQWMIMKMELTKEESLWLSIRKQWFKCVVRTMIPTDAFPAGGDRTSLLAKGRQQQVILRLAEERARAAPETKSTETVLLEVIHEVQQRWVAPDGTTLERLLRLVVRRSRRRGDSQTEEIEEVEDEAALMAAFDKAQVVERAPPQLTPLNRDSGVTDGIPPEFLSAELLLHLVELKRCALNLEQTRAETDKIHGETERLRADTDRIKAETRKLQVENHIGSDRKRVRSVDHVVRDAEGCWSGLQSLSAMVWRSAPPSSTMGPSSSSAALRTVYTDVLQRSRTSNTKHRVRFLPAASDDADQTPVPVVYVGADVDVADWARRFWEEDTATPAVDTANTLAVGPPAPHLSPAPLAAPLTDGRQQLRRRPTKLPVGTYDLAAAVLDGTEEGLDNGGDRAALRRRLDERFVRSAAMSRDWAVLWPSKRPADPSVIPTTINVHADPIVPQLREWLLRADDGEEPPAYPAVGACDPRPPEPVPEGLQPVSADVWPLLQAAAGLTHACARVLPLYARSQGLPVPAAQTPCQERLRQWQRLLGAANDDGLPFRHIVECLDWAPLTAHDSGLVQSLTAVLLARRGLPPSAWYVRRNSGHYWKVGLCLAEMRAAAVFVSRLYLGGADNLACLAVDVHRLATTPTLGGPRPNKGGGGDGP